LKNHFFQLNKILGSYLFREKPWSRGL